MKRLQRIKPISSVRLLERGIDETTVQEALAIAREILEVVQRYEQR